MEAAMFQICLSAVSAALCTSAIVASAAEARDRFVPPPTILHTFYDGNSNDLLTAGLGKSRLGDPTPPGFVDAQHPTAEELRTSAIYNNYRALVDPTRNGGYGVLYGPNVGVDGVPTDSEGKIAGDEYIAFAHDASGRKKVTMMVQVPSQFDPAKACIITAPSSGSRGIYGAIATGEWGLKHGCAVAYTDKGTGTGAHDLDANTVNLIRGKRADAANAGEDSNFTAALTPAERAAFNAATPHRFAFKHAHSQQNPEQDWGENVLESIRFAFYVLRQKYGPRINKRNTIVIASSVSNGGGASLRALEADRERLIDGLAVAEPNVNPAPTRRFSIVQEGRAPLTAHSRPLIDYTTLINVYQACANMAPENAEAPLNPKDGTARCESLKAKGLLTATTPAEQARETQRIINDYGILPEQNLVQPGYWRFLVPQSISVTYANAYGRFSVADNLCAFSFGVPTAGIPALDAEAAAAIFGWSSGIPPVTPSSQAPPTSRLALINNAAPNGPAESSGSTADQNLDGALCLRSLAAGNDGKASQRRQAERLARGVAQIRASGDLHGVPAIIVTGRNDAIIAPNHASRAYFGLNQMIEGRRSRLRYYEVTNAQHLDALNALPDYAKAYVPLHYYFLQALDLMYEHLRSGRELPPSQLVRTRPRGDATKPISADNVPRISDAPPPGDRITFSAAQVRIPN
jgi:hydroxybutyrate-dimer hydrolase